jgi:hypothetical protein
MTPGVVPQKPVVDFFLPGEGFNPRTVFVGIPGL